MLNFLRQEIAKKEKEQKKAFHVQDEELHSELDEAILECAHLFNEMEELTIVGTNAQRERPVIDIPIEDDIELDLVEVDTKTGRIVDIPMDVQATESFKQELTYEHFYQEALHSTPRFNRESDQSYLNRVQAKAVEEYDEYYAYIVQEGLFGHDMISIDDPRVPGTAMIDFGKHGDDGSRHFMAKLPVYFQTEGDHQVSLNQIHSLTVAQNLDVFADLSEALKAMLVRDGHQKAIYNKNIWDVATPLYILIPRVKEEYSVGVEIEVDGVKDHYFLTWSIPKSKVDITTDGKVKNKEELMKQAREGSSEGRRMYPGDIKESTKEMKEKTSYMCKKDFKAQAEAKVVKESYYNTPNRWTRGRRDNVYQEAIDFGGDTTPAQAPAPADPGTPPAIGGGDTAPADPNAGGGDTTGGAPADTGMGGDTGTADPNVTGNDVEMSPDASTATTNDVSQQIADNVANATAANTAAQSNTDIMNTNPTFDNNVDDTFANLDTAMDATDNPDMGGMDAAPTDAGTDAGATETDPLLSDTGAPTDDASGLDVGGDASMTDPTDTAASLDDIQTDIDDADASASGLDDASANKEMGAVDLDNMSMDDMIQQGIEKLKTMPMAQLREFLGDGAGAIGASTPSDDMAALEASLFEKDVEDEIVLEFENDVRSELNTGIRSILGNLNAADKPMKDIFRDVKHDAKHLNRVVNRAIHTKNFKYARKELEKLGHSLNDLSMKLNDTPIVGGEVQGIKDAIKHFTGAVRDTSRVVDLSVKTAGDVKGAVNKKLEKDTDAQGGQ